MREQQGTQGTHLRDAGWQCLQAVEAQIQVRQACQATQSGRQCGQGAPEAGTQRIPLLSTWEGEADVAQSQVPWPCPQGKSCGGRYRPAVPPHPETDSCRGWMKVGTETTGSSQRTAITQDPQEKHAHWVCWENPLGSCTLGEEGWVELCGQQ